MIPLILIGAAYLIGKTIKKDKFKYGGFIHSIDESIINLIKNGIVVTDNKSGIMAILYNTSGQSRESELYNYYLIYKTLYPIDKDAASRIVFNLDKGIFDEFDFEKISKYKKSNNLIICNQNEVLFNSYNPDLRYDEGGKLSSLKSLEQLDYQLRYPKENKLLFLDADKLLKRHSIDNPSFDITLKENQIGNRVQKAKDYITDYLLDNRWINRRTNERENIKIKFEPSIAGIYNGKLCFEDGRHRVLAAKELGFKKVAVEVPNEQVAEFEKYFK